jgi:hypothetical protein
MSFVQRAVSPALTQDTQRDTQFHSHTCRGAKKMYTHAKKHVDTLVNAAQAAVRRNHFEHLL